jgi:hypothetical protein
MDLIKNISESFFREIRMIEIYKSSSLSYIDNFNGRFPLNPVFSFEVVPETFERNIDTKQRNKNTYFPIDVSFSLLDLKLELRNMFYEKLNRKGFMIVLYSNTEKVALGNTDEDLAVYFIDAIKDNNSGEDQFMISVTGETIIPPKASKL